jgi:hypothetical protein
VKGKIRQTNVDDMEVILGGKAKPVDSPDRYEEEFGLSGESDILE